MSEQQVDRALMALRAASVHPPLVSEDSLRATVRSVPKRRLMLWYFAALIMSAVIVGKWIVPWSDVALGRRMSTSETIGPGSAVTTNASAIAGEARHVAAVQDGDVSAIDPNSIMLLRLNREELRAIGIHVSDDRVSVEQLLMLGDVPGLSHQAQEQGCDTSFAGKLLSFTHSYSQTHIDQHRLDSCLDTFPQKIFVEDVSAYTGSFFHEDALALPSALTPPDLWRSIHWLARDSSVIPIAERMKGTGYYVPKWRVYRRDAKPIVLVVPTTTNGRSYLIWMMPTARVHARLPRRYETSFRLLYDEYVPQHRLPVNMLALAEKMFAVTLIRDEGQAGLTAIEIGDDELWRLGVILDPQGVITVNGYLKDTTVRNDAQRSFVQGVVAHGSHRIQGFRWPCGQDELLRMGGGLIDTVVQLHRTETAQFEIPQALSFRVIDANGAVLNAYGSATMGKGWLDSTWGNSHGHVADLLVRVAGKLALCNSNIDSILSFQIVEGSVRLPVSKLLVPVRMTTPWIVDSTLQPPRRKRLETILWYAPTERFFTSLPLSVRAFIEPEYRAVVSMIEEELGQQEVCEQLLVPSALGLCTQRDTVVRLDGIGPIPAREYMTINLYSRIDAPVMVKLIDQSGTLIYELPMQHIARGPNQLTIPLPAQALQQGAYTVVIDCAGHLVTSRVLIER